MLPVRGNGVALSTGRVICLYFKGYSVEVSESQGQERFHGGEAVDTLGSGEIYGHVVTGQLFIFQQSLAAGAARGSDVGDAFAVCFLGSDGDGFEGVAFMFGSGIVACGAFCACARGICGVFLIGAGDYRSRSQAYRSAYVEVAVGCICAVGGCPGGIHKSCFGGGEFVVGLYFDRYYNIKLLHSSNYWDVRQTSPGKSVHHAPNVGYIAENKRHEERNIKHGAKRKLAAATVGNGQ